MPDLSLGYEVILVPALWALALLTAIGVLIKGINRTTQEVDGYEIGKWGYNGRMAVYAGGVVLGAFLLLPAIVVTPPGHRAVIYSAIGGVQDVERGEGVSLVFPYVQVPKLVDVREQKFFSDEVFAQSKDLQEITVHVAVNYSVVPHRASDLIQDVSADYETVLILPAVQQLVKQEVGLINAVDFAQNRAQLAEDVRTSLRTRLNQNGLLISFVAIEDAVFDADFITAVKNKVIADEVASMQERLIAAEAAKKLQAILIAEANEQTLLIEGRGYRAMIEQIAGALGFTAEEYLNWMLIQAWDGVMPTTLLGDAGNLDVLLAVD